MTPTLVHRYTWPIREAIERLLGDAAGDCEAWRIRIEGDEVVIDVVAPSSNDAAKSYMVAPAADASPLIKNPKPDIAPAEPPRKGGPLARQAGIICGEKGFWTFLVKRFGAETSSGDEAANWVRAHCAIQTRADLDYEPAAAERFKDLSRRYALWLEGFD